MTRKVLGMGVVAALAALMVTGVAFGQPGGGAGGPGGGMGPGGGGFGGDFDPAEFQKRMDDMNRESLGATAEEWKVLGPKFNKVQTLSRSVNPSPMFGMRRGGMGGQGGQRRGGMGMFGGEPTALDKAREALNTALENTSATPEQLQAALKTFREAREKAKKELADAQADLKKALTVKQEVALVASGLLD